MKGGGRIRTKKKGVGQSHGFVELVNSFDLVILTHHRPSVIAHDCPKSAERQPLSKHNTSCDRHELLQLELGDFELGDKLLEMLLETEHMFARRVQLGEPRVKALARALDLDSRRRAKCSTTGVDALASTLLFTDLAQLILEEGPQGAK